MKTKEVSLSSEMLCLSMQDFPQWKAGKSRRQTTRKASGSHSEGSEASVDTPHRELDGDTAAP